MEQTVELQGVTTLEDIRKVTKEYADAREILVSRVDNLNRELESTKRRYLTGIRNAVALASDAKAVVVRMVDGAKGLFGKPHTQVMHGIKVGLQKQKDALDWDSDEALVKAIRKHLPGLAETLIRTVEKPISDALAELPVADLRKLGVRMVPGGDTIVVKPTDSDVDKLVSALLKDAEAEASEPNPNGLEVVS